MTLYTLSYRLFLLLLLIAPIFFASNRPLFWSILEMIVGGSFFAWFYAVYRSNAKFPAVSSNYFLFPLYGFLAILFWCVIQMLPLGLNMLPNTLWTLMANTLDIEPADTISTSPAGTFEGVRRLVMYGTVFFLALQLGRNAKQAAFILKTMMYVCAACAVYGLLMHSYSIEKVLWLDKQGYIGSLCGTFINRNNFATYCGIGMVISLGYFFENLIRKETKLKYIFRENLNRKVLSYFAISVVFFTAILLTHSRAGLISTLIALICLIVLFFSRTGISKKSRSIVLTITGGIFIILLIYGASPLLERFSKFATKGDLRSDIYATTIRAIEDNVWLGTGLETFEGNFNFYRDQTYPIFVSTKVDHAHNTYLETALELGVPFTLLFLSIYLWLFVKIVCGYYSRKQNRLFSLIAVSSMILVGLHSLLDFSLEMPAVAIMFASIMGVALAQSWSSRKNLFQRNTKDLLLFSLVCIGITITSIFAFIRLPSAYIEFVTERPISVIYRDNENRHKLAKEIFEELAWGLSFPLSSSLYKEAAMLSEYIATYSSPFSTEQHNWENIARKYVQETLKYNPLDSASWRRFSYLELINNGMTKKAADALHISALTNSYNVETLFERLRLLPALWDASSTEAKELYIREIQFAWFYTTRNYKKHIVAALNNSTGNKILMKVLEGHPEAIEQVEKIEKHLLKNQLKK